MRKMCFVVFALALMTSLAAAQITHIITLHASDANGAITSTGSFTVKGVVTTINLDGGALQFYLQDATGGVQVFKSGSSSWYSSKGLAIGKEITVTGVLDQYYSMLEIVPANETDITVLGDGVIPDPEEITINDLQDLTVADQNRFNKRGKLVVINNVYKADPKPAGGTDWPELGKDSNKFCIAIGSPNATPTGILRFDKDTDCDENPEPTWPQNVRGVFTQNDGSSPFFSVFQVSPMAYTDFSAYTSVNDWEMY